LTAAASAEYMRPRAVPAPRLRYRRMTPGIMGFLSTDCFRN
jgi:hypothetical protein